MATSTIRTVRGDVPADAIGTVMTHEHLFLDSRKFWDPSLLHDASIGEQKMLPEFGGLARWYGASIRDNLALLPKEDFDLVCTEVADFKAAAGDGACLVELTPAGVGRAPTAVREVSEKLDLHVVMGSGFYVHATHPAWVDDATTDELADHLLDEVTNGIDGTGIRPGMIGEVGTSEVLQPCEERVLRAAARVANQTGLAINVHMHPPSLDVAMQVLDALETENHDLTRTSVSHLDEISDLDYHTAVLDRGVVTGFDSFGQDGYFSPNWKSLSDNTKARTLTALIEKGYEDQLVLAQDICKKHHLLTYGGLGYSHVVRRVVPRLKDVFALNDETIAKLLTHTPRRLLSISG